MSSRTGPIFERLASRYDAWYEEAAGSVLFPLEVDCLAPLLAGAPRPSLEVGVGSGRFAEALAVEVGLDPARSPLLLAQKRGIRVVQGVGERLPFPDGCFGAVLVVVTLCFADDPEALLVEVRRVLHADGSLVLGMVFADTPWGQWYQAQGQAGHPFYSAAHFLTRDEVKAMLKRAGLTVVAARSTLLQPPSDAPRPETARDADQPEAGFAGWKAVPCRAASGRPGQDQRGGPRTHPYPLPTDGGTVGGCNRERQVRGVGHPLLNTHANTAHPLLDRYAAISPNCDRRLRLRCVTGVLVRRGRFRRARAIG
jgi:SAM-dependent methyltransferase